MAEIAELGLRIDGRQAISDLTKVETKLKATGTAAESAGAKGVKSFGQLRGSVLALGTSILGITAGFSLFRSSISILADFEKSMAGVAAVTGATGKTFDDLSSKARELGAITSFSATEAAEGMRFLGQAGFETKEILDAIGPSLQLAQAGMLDLASAADIVSNIMSGFQIAATETSAVADILAVTAANANTNIQQMGEAMKFVAPVAASTGQSIEEMAALVGVLGDAGLQSTLAGTGLRMSILALTKPTSSAKKAIAELGLTVEELDPSTTSLVDIVNKLADANIGAGQASAIFGARAATSILALAGATKRIDEMVQKTSNATGELDKMAKIMEDTLSGAAKRATSAMSEFALQAGDRGLGPALRDAVDLITDTISALNGMLDPLDKNNKAAFQLADALTLVGVILVSFAGAKVIAMFWAMGAAILSTYTSLITLAAGTTASAGSFSLLTGTMVGATAATSGLTAVFTALTRVMMANPIVALTFALAIGGTALLSYRSKVKATTDEVDRLAASTKAAADAMNPFARLTKTQMVTALATVEKNLEGASLVLEKMTKQFEKGKLPFKDYKVMSDTVEGMRKQIDLLNSLLNTNSKTTKQVVDETKKFTEAEKDLLEELLAGETVAKEWVTQLEILNEIKNKNLITDEQYKKAIDQLNESLLDTIIVTEQVSKKATPIAQIYKDTATGIQSAFARTFREVFDDGLGSFKNLGDRILDVFKDMLAQMITLALVNPIIIPLVQALGGGLGLGQTAISGVTGQLGGAAAGGFLSGAASGGVGSFLSGVGSGAAAQFGATSSFVGPPTAAGAAGASVGSVVPYVAAALAINALTGGALFGGKKKQTGAGVELDVAGTGIIGQEFTQFKKKRSLFQGTRRWTEFKALSEDAQNSLNAAMDFVSGSLVAFGDLLDTNLLQNLEGFKASFKGSAEQSEIFLQDTVKNMFLQGFSGVGELLPAVARLDFSKPQKAFEDLKFAVDFVTGALFEEAKKTTNAQKALDVLNKSFDDMSSKVSSFGLNLTNLEKARVKSIAAMVGGFNEGIQEQILKINNPMQFELDEFNKISMERLQNARDLGANILEVEKLNALRRGEIVRSSSEKTVDALRSVTDFVSSLSFSEFSPVTPQEQLTIAEDLFETALAKAGTGDTEAISALPAAAETFLREGKEFFAGTEGFTNIFDRVTNALGDIVTTQGDPIITQLQENGLQDFENSQAIINAIEEMKEEIVLLRRDNAVLSDNLIRLQA